MAGNRRLLVVEDDPGLNALVTRKLQRAGFPVESALTGAAALDAVRRDPNVLLLLDYLLPDVTARELLERLKANGQEAPFVVMTGHGDEKVAVEMMKLGARDYLVKDADLGDVLPEVVRRVLAQLATEERLKEAEQALEQSERNLRTLAQNIPGIVYRVHLRDRNRMEFFNDMLSEMTGYRENELRRGEVSSIDPLILFGDRASVVDSVRRAVGKTTPFQVDYRLTHRDGSIRHFSEQGRPVPDADGRPVYVDGVIFDVTEARLSAESVRLNQERLAEAQRISHLGSWLWDIRGRQSFCSAELFRILGLEPDSAPPTQTTFLARVHPDDRPYFEARVAEATRNRTSYDFDLRVVRPEGVERFVHGETNVEYDAAGEPVLVSGTCQDVTERRQAEEGEKRRAAELNLLSESATEFIRMAPGADIYGHIANRVRELAAGAYVVVNSFDPAAQEFTVRAVAGLGGGLKTMLKLMGGTRFSLTPEELRAYASATLKIIPEGVRGLAFGVLSESLAATLTSTFRLGGVYAMSLFRQDRILGTVNIMMRRKTVLPNPGVVETYVNQAAIAVQRAQVEDELMKHRQHLEELVGERTRELKQAQDALVLHERLAAIGKVAGSMAHEIRNPLAAMRNAAYFLNSTLDSQLHRKAARHLEIINREIDVANGIITSVLDFARGRPAELVTLNLADVLAIAQERAVLPEGVQVRRSIPFDLPMVRIDLQQMVQVFLNLLTNAAEAMSGKGRVTVSAQARDGKVRVSFRDEGPGIAPENLGRVFEPLFSTKAVGIGMGLTVCKSFVESSNGTIEVESEPGQGATFVITLPAV
jgi:PAS domain S-box-containing protein